MLLPANTTSNYLVIILLTGLAFRNGAKKCECCPAPPAMTICRYSGFRVIGTSVSGVTSPNFSLNTFCSGHPFAHDENGIRAYSQIAFAI